MKTAVTRKGLTQILIFTAVMIFAGIVLRPFTPAARQSRNLAAANEHAQRLTPTIHADPRFAQITLGGYTGGDGMFWVVGRVPSQKALEDLKTLIIASHPPVETEWTVKIDDFPQADTAPSNEK